MSICNKNVEANARVNLVYAFRFQDRHPIQMLSRVIDGDLGVRGTLSVHSSDQPIGGIANRAPRHRWSTIRSLKVDGGEDG